MFRSCLVVKNPLLVLASVFLIAACRGGTAAAAAPTPIKFTMTTQNGSGVTGTGEIIRATGSFTLTIKLTGMTPNSSHVSHLHAARCGVPGGIVYALQQVIADSAGAATHEHSAGRIPGSRIRLVRQRPPGPGLHGTRVRTERLVRRPLGSLDPSS
jgi:hypothetical protein